MVELQSTTTSRVVTSTVAGESASLSTALDRQLYLRLLVQSLMYGEPEYTPDWRHKLVIPGIMITNAKSLHENLNTTSSIPKERQTMIDLLVAQGLVEAGMVRLCWIPTNHVLVDAMTKVMKPSEMYVRFREKHRW